MGYIDLDTETLGFDSTNEVFSIAYEVDNGERVSAAQMLFVEHDGIPGPWTLKNTPYLKAFKEENGRYVPTGNYPIYTRENAARKIIQDCMSMGLSEADLSGANPNFDARVLDPLFARANIRPPWQRLFPGEVATMVTLGISHAGTLHRCATALELERRGEAHDAFSDVTLSAAVRRKNALLRDNYDFAGFESELHLDSPYHENLAREISDLQLIAKSEGSGFIVCAMNSIGLAYVAVGEFGTSPMRFVRLPEVDINWVREFPYAYHLHKPTDPHLLEALDRINRDINYYCGTKQTFFVGTDAYAGFNVFDEIARSVNVPMPFDIHPISPYAMHEALYPGDPTRRALLHSILDAPQHHANLTQFFELTEDRNGIEQSHYDLRTQVAAELSFFTRTVRGSQLGARPLYAQKLVHPSAGREITRPHGTESPMVSVQPAAEPAQPAPLLKIA